MMDDRRNQLNFDLVSETCPWRTTTNPGFPLLGVKPKKKCKPIPYFRNVSWTLWDCTQKTCPIMHFQKYFAAVGMYNR